VQLSPQQVEEKNRLRFSNHNGKQMTDNQPLPQVPDYDLIRPIGEGGFGRVWLAANQTTGQLRAVKLIPLRQSGSTDAAGREIVSLTRLEANRGCRHQNLLCVYHVGKTAEHLFYVMDLADDISGRPATDDPNYQAATLQKRLEIGPKGDSPIFVNTKIGTVPSLDPEECLHCARQLLSGLAALHRSGMVHRDVKPANCIFVSGELKLADFSLLTEASPLVSRAGTQKYMPPDGRMDMRADVYAAGLVIYEMVTGLPADRFPSLGERAVNAVDDHVLISLIRLTLRACEPNPQLRFKTAGEMLDELENNIAKARVHRTRFARLTKTIAACIFLFILIATAGLWVSRPDRVHVNFVTYPFEASIYLDDVQQVDAQGVPFRTPCTIDDLAAKSYRVTFQHDQYGVLDAGQQDFARQRRVEARWEGKLE
jgi:serine/threonine protein kinase